ncbi:MAG TPA: hypothetical protein VG722_01140, partial [Tepidisphaeraceae bacterium]|nr:hypothetical protein [Tepidisphaeraceae bacterium]
MSTLRIPSALAGIVQEIYVDAAGADKSPTPYRVLPGLSATIGFQYRGRLSVQRDGATDRLATSGVTGLQSGVRWFQPQPETRNVLIRFSTHGLYRLLG